MNFTELKNLQLNLKQKIRELERSNMSLEEFAHAASHDLKEPVRKIHVFADRLKSKIADRLTKEDTQIFKRVETSAERMKSLIDDLRMLMQELI